MGLTNVEIMVPFVRTLAQARNVVAMLAERGLRRRADGRRRAARDHDVRSRATRCSPNSSSKHFDGMSIGSNDLTQLATLGLDRDSGLELLARDFDERDPAVEALIARAMTAAAPPASTSASAARGRATIPTSLSGWRTGASGRSRSIRTAWSRPGSAWCGPLNGRDRVRRSGPGGRRRRRRTSNNADAAVFRRRLMTGRTRPSRSASWPSSCRSSCSARMGLPKNWIGTLFLGGTVIVYAIIGVICPHHRGRRGYVVAGRRVPAFYNGMATGADWMSAASFIGPGRDALPGAFGHGRRSRRAGLRARLDGRVLPRRVLLAPHLRRFGHTIPDFLGGAMAAPCRD